jgi:tryptophan 2,3-dioxygenase
VTRRFVQMLATDNCAEVRRATLGAIAISKASLEALLQRTSDVHIEVRAAAFSALATRVPCRALSIAQRVALVRNGLTDREERVRKMALTMIVDHWLAPEAVGETGDLFSLLDLLDLEEHESAAEMLVRALIDANKAPPMPPNPLLSDEVAGAAAPAADDEDSDDSDSDGDASAGAAAAVVPTALALSPAVALFWRVRCDVAQANSEWALLEELLPSGAALCRGVLQSAASPFVQRQLILIGALMDLKDEAGRRMLSTLLRNTLGVLSTEEQLIAPMTALLAKIHTGEDEFTMIVLETMSDVKDVLEQYEQPEVQAMLAAEVERLRANEEKLARLARKGGAEDSVQALVAETAELRAQQELRAQLEEGTWLRCMSLAATLLQNTTRSTSDPRIGGLRHTILAAVRNANALVREAGVRATGLFALIDATAAMVHVPLLVAVLTSDQMSVRVPAARALVDLMLLYGEPSALLAAKLAEGGADADADGDELADLRLAAKAAPLAALQQTLDSAEVSELRSVVVEGFAKLLFNNRVEPKPRLVARLLFLLYEPGTALDAAVRQCLAVFVPAYAHTGPLHREALAAACAVALPALAACGENASVADCGGYLLSLLRDGGADNRCVHADVARVVAEQVYASPTVATRKEWCKLASELRLAAGAIERRALEELAFVVAAAVDCVSAKDRVAKRQIELLAEAVQQRCAADKLDSSLNSAALSELRTDLTALRDTRGLSAMAEKLVDGATALASSQPAAAKATTSSGGATAAKPKPKAATGAAARRPRRVEAVSDDESDDDDDESEDEASIELGDDDDSDEAKAELSSDSDDERVVSVQRAPAVVAKENAPQNSRLAGKSGLGPAKKAVEKPKAVPTVRRRANDDDDDDDGFEKPKRRDAKPTPKRGVAPRAAAAAKPIPTLVLSSDDDSVEELSDSGDAFGAARTMSKPKGMASALFQ